MKEKQKIIVILGPTASGKSDLAVQLAKKWDGEIVSADSRQVYKGMNIGTGKITKKEMTGIKHYLLDVANPKQTFNAEKFKVLAKKAIKEITKKGKIPIICGGTGFYIDVLLGKITTANVPPNKKLRQELEKEKTNKLFKKLQKINPDRAKNIDPKNKRRLIRAIEIVKSKSKSKFSPKTSSYNFDPLYIGIKISRENLAKKIESRLKKRIKTGMIAEAKNLLAKGISHKKLQEFGLEYKFLSLLVQGKITRKEFEQNLNIAIKQYAKRQETWFKRNKEIGWIALNGSEKSNNSILGKANKLIKSFLK